MRLVKATLLAGCAAATLLLAGCESTEEKAQRNYESAVELAEKIFGSLAASRVVLIGAGDTGEKTARAMFSRGLQGLVVTNRTFERAVELADRLGGAAVPLSEWR